MALSIKTKPFLRRAEFTWSQRVLTIVFYVCVTVMPILSKILNSIPYMSLGLAWALRFWVRVSTTRIAGLPSSLVAAIILWTVDLHIGGSGWSLELLGQPSKLITHVNALRLGERKESSPSGNDRRRTQRRMNYPQA